MNKTHTAKDRSKANGATGCRFAAGDAVLLEQPHGVSITGVVKGLYEQFVVLWWDSLGFDTFYLRQDNESLHRIRV